MDYESAAALKSQILADLERVIAQDVPAPAGAQSCFPDDTATVEELYVPPNPGTPVAVGISPVRPHEFRLELRVQRGHPAALRLAEAVVERLGAEANLEVIPEIGVPSRQEVAGHRRCTPVMDEKGRIELGLSIGPRGEGAGTLGAFLYREDGLYLLSCNHVLVPTRNAHIADANREGGTAIYHPGDEPGTVISAARQVAALADYVPYTQREANRVDSAIARADLSRGWQFDINRIPVGYGYPDEGHPITAMDGPIGEQGKGLRVAKIGRSTCYTEGRIESIETDGLAVSVPELGVIRFDNVIEVRPEAGYEAFSQPGDSGSLVFTKDGKQALGIIFAGEKGADKIKVSYVIPLTPILAWAKATLVS